MKIQALLEDGSVVHKNEIVLIERALGKHLDWEEVPDTRQTAGSYFQVIYEAEVSEEEFLIADEAVSNTSSLKAIREFVTNHDKGYFTIIGGDERSKILSYSSKLATN